MKNSQKKDITVIALIIFNSLWSMMLLTQGFITLPAFDNFLKKLYYFVY